jgi:hypothetical protein
MEKVFKKRMSISFYLETEPYEGVRESSSLIMLRSRFYLQKRTASSRSSFVLQR